MTRHVIVTVATGSSPAAAAISKRRTVSSKGAVETEKPVNYAVIIARDKIKVSIRGVANVIVGVVSIWKHFKGN